MFIPLWILAIFVTLSLFIGISAAFWMIFIGALIVGLISLLFMVAVPLAYAGLVVLLIVGIIKCKQRQYIPSFVIGGSIGFFLGLIIGDSIYGTDDATFSAAVIGLAAFGALAVILKKQFYSKSPPDSVLATK